MFIRQRLQVVCNFSSLQINESKNIGHALAQQSFFERRAVM
jgi:hypothetical protein